jgi:hypothetical protein
MSCKCVGGVIHPDCEDHGLRKLAIEEISRQLRGEPPAWKSRWVSPPCICVCESPDCIYGDRWMVFFLQEDQFGHVFFQVLPADNGTGEPYRGHVSERTQIGYGFDGKVYPYRYDFARAKAEIEECMKEGTTFTGFPHWHLELTGGMLPIKKVEAWKQ